MPDSQIVLTRDEVDALLPEALHDYFRPCLDALELDVPASAPRSFRCHPRDTVYFIGGAGGAIKIGFTRQSMPARLKCIQNGSPVKLEILATQNAPREREQWLHRHFAAHRLHGEWFEPHPDILAEIERLTTLHDGRG